jgi:hypothetical protein
VADEEERQDVETLRAEVTDLQRQLDQTRAEKKGGIKRKLRSIVVVVLIVLGSVLAPISAFTIYLRNFVLDTNEYLAVVGPLPQDPVFADGLATQITNQLFARVDVQNAIKDALPNRADFLADPLAGTIKSATHAAAYRVVSSDQFHTLWIQANRRAHEALVGVLTGSGNGALSADQSGKVTLDLHTLAVKVVDQLDASGMTVFNKIPVDKIGGEVTLFTAPGIVQLQGLTKTLNTLAYVLPFLSLACFLGAVGAANRGRRRRALYYDGMGLGISMAVFAILLGLVRSYLITAAAHGKVLNPNAAGILFDAFLAVPREWLRIMFGIGVAVSVLTWLAGSSRPAAAIRRSLVRAARWIGGLFTGRDWHLGVAGRWIGQSEGPVEFGIGFVGFLILIIWGSPGIVGALVVVLIVAALILLVHFVATRARAEQALEEGRGPPDGPPGEAGGDPVGPSKDDGHTGGGQEGALTSGGSASEVTPHSSG